MSTSKMAALGVAFGLGASVLAMFPSVMHTEAAVATIDKTNIKHAYDTLLETIKIYETNMNQLQLLMANAEKMDPEKVLEYQLNALVQKKINDDTWCHIDYSLPGVEKPPRNASMKELLAWYMNHQNRTSDYGIPEGILTGSMDTSTEWTKYLGDLQAILNGNASIGDVLQNEEKRQKALNMTFKSVADAAQTTQNSNNQIMASTQKALEAVDDPNASMTQIMQHTAHIEANQTMIMLNGFSMIGKALQSEAAANEAQNVRNAETQTIVKNSAAKAAADADKISIK
jgi:hypothetical protein